MYTGHITKQLMKMRTWFNIMYKPIHGKVTEYRS